MKTPDSVKELLAMYEHVEELPVRFRPASWAVTQDVDYALLTAPSLTAGTTSDPHDRLIHSETLEEVFTRTSIEDAVALRQLFVLVMAWGSGTSNPRSYRHTRAALADPRLEDALRSTAEVCRGSELDDLRKAYGMWRVTGVQRSFFTKWFRFAGHTPGRSWQPLILDDRVLSTLNSTLNISTRDVAESRRWADRYVAYIRLIHEWAGALDRVTAQRIEWVLFMHNGRDLSDTSTKR